MSILMRHSEEGEMLSARAGANALLLEGELFGGPPEGDLHGSREERVGSCPPPPPLLGKTVFLILLTCSPAARVCARAGLLTPRPQVLATEYPAAQGTRLGSRRGTRREGKGRGAWESRV